MGCMKELREGATFCPYCGFELGKCNTDRVLQPGTVLNEKYLIGKVIGDGGFGITYVAYDTVLEARVAIKEYFPTELVSRSTSTGIQTSVSVLTGSAEDQYKKGMSRFIQEAENLAKFNHLPGIVSVRDFFYANNTAYMVMEYIDGITLKEYLVQHRKKLPYQTVLGMMKPVMDSLQTVHEAGIIHRDISPDNIMVVNSSSTAPQLKLIDFGAARFVGSNDEKSLTVILKHGYAPPEQYQTNGKQGSWTDVYALAATMYQMITGIVPQEATDRLLSGDRMKPLAVQEEGVSKNVSDAITRGLETDIKNRTKSVRELENELYLYKDRSKHRNWAVGLVVLIAAVLLCAIVLPLVRGSNAPNENGDITSKSNSGTSLPDTDEAKMTERLNDTDDSEVNLQGKEVLSEEKLLSWIEQFSEQPMDDVLYKDFNDDGICEMFASFSTIEAYEDEYTPKEYCNRSINQVWYADKNTVKLVDEFIVYNLKVSDYCDKKNIDNQYTLTFYPTVKDYQTDTFVDSVEQKKYELINNNPQIVKEAYEWSKVQSSSPGQPEEDKEELLKEKINGFCSYPVNDSFYDDFDGDGLKEMIALCAEPEAQSMFPISDYTYRSKVHVVFADHDTVEEVAFLQTGGYDLEEAAVQTFGKAKMLVFPSYRAQYHTEIVGYNGRELYHREMYGVVSSDSDQPLIRMNVTPPLDYYVFFPNGWKGMYDYYEDLQLYFLNDNLYILSGIVIEEDYLDSFVNINRIREEIDASLESGDIIDSWADSSEYIYYQLDSVLYSADGNIYINYERWKQPAPDEDKEEYIRDFFGNSDYFDVRDIMRYCYAQLSVNDDRSLNLEGLFAGYKLGGSYGVYGVNPFYPNMKVFIDQNNDTASIGGINTAYGEEVTEGVLMSWIKQIKERPADNFICDDFDGDGLRDLFAVFVKWNDSRDNYKVEEDYKNDIVFEVWYADRQSVKQVVTRSAMLASREYGVQLEKKDGVCVVSYVSLIDGGVYNPDAYNKDTKPQIYEMEFIIDNGYPLFATKDKDASGEFLVDVDLSVKQDNVSEEFMVNMARKTGLTVEESFYEDFDDDGFKEMFLLCQDEDDDPNTTNSVYFTDGMELVSVGTVHQAQRYDDVEEKNRVVQMGKNKMLFCLNDSAQTRFTDVFGVEKGLVFSTVIDATVISRDGKTEVRINPPLLPGIHEAVYEDFQLYYYNGTFYILSFSKLPTDRLYGYSNWGDVDETIIEEMTALSADYPCMIIDSVCYGADGYLYANIACFKNEYSKLWYENEVEIFCDPNRADGKSYYSEVVYRYVKIGVDDDRLEFVDVFDGYIPTEVGSFMNWYPNMRDFI